MKKMLSFAMMFSVVFMVGCEQKDYQTPAERKSLSSTTHSTQVNSETYQSTYVSDEDKELAAMVTKMKQEDPTIIDAYYSVGENGQKVLNLVKQDATTPNGSSGTSTTESGISTFMWGMAGGLTASMLMNSFMNNRGNMNAMTNQYKPMSTNRGNYASYQAQKNSAISQYRTSGINQNKFNPSTNTSKSIDTTKKLTPVAPSAVKAAPLSQDAYRTAPPVTNKPASTLSQPVETRVIKQAPTQTSSYKKSSSLFKPSPFKRRR